MIKINLLTEKKQAEADLERIEAELRELLLPRDPGWRQKPELICQSEHNSSP